MTWVYTRRGAVGWLKAQGVCAEQSGDYEHDAVDHGALMELLGESGIALAPPAATPSVGASPVEDGQQEARNADAPATEAPPERQFAAPTQACSLPSIQPPQQVFSGFETPEAIQPALPPWEEPSELDAVLEQFDAVDDLKLSPVVEADGHFDFDVPDVEAGDEEDPRELVPEVTEDRRARQLATKFLLETGESLTLQNVDRIVDIILARRWSSTQRRVRELLDAGCDLRQVHVVFQLTEAWRQCDAMDERLGERRSMSWTFNCMPRLTWDEALELHTFVGAAADVEDVLAFAEAERHVWRSNSSLVATFGRFKQYLLEYRIQPEVDDPVYGMIRALDPQDGRCFYAVANPEYSSDWWDDTIADRWSRSAIASRIYQGASLESMLRERTGQRDWEN